MPKIFVSRLIPDAGLSLLRQTFGESSVVVAPQDADSADEIPVHLWDIRYTSDSVSFVIQTDRPGILFVSEANAPGWTATVDGNRVPVFTANYHFRAVTLQTGGRHHIEFRYRPLSVRIGAMVTLVSILLAAALVFFGYPRVKREIY